MILQNLLEDKRYEWQKATQEQIMSSLLCKTHKYKAIGQRSEKLVMVFGKSHSGKTTLILSLMGVAEEKLADLNHILRAGIPEGKSSTSTAIIYQKSEDDYFGVCEHSLNQISEHSIVKCTEEEFVTKIKDTRLSVENHKRNNKLVLYLYIPRSYFGNSDFVSQQINILDVPGYETTNLGERYHTEALLKKYMSVSALNIVVRSIYDINDLRYFSAPNGDDFTKLTSGKYIIVTTRSYSQESVFKYFLKQPQERNNTFEEMLCEECRIQLERVFGPQIPTYFPVDIGESFNELINTKVTNQVDRDYLLAYRKKMFDGIYECIYNKQSNSLISWVNEIVEDEEYYGKKVASETDEKLRNVIQLLKFDNRKSDKKKGAISRCEQRLEELNEIIEGLVAQRQSFMLPEIGERIENEVNSCKDECFTSDFKWRNSDGPKDLSVIFAELFTKIVEEQINDFETEHEVITENIKRKWKDVVDEMEIEIQETLNKAMNAHTRLRVLNPSNKKKIEIGKNKLNEVIPELIGMCYGEILREYDEEIERKKSKKNTLRILINGNKRKVDELRLSIKKKEEEKKQLEEKREAIRCRKEKDKELLRNYREIVYENFARQKREVIELMNKSSSKEEKMEYLILLGLMDKDYRKIAME